MEVKINLDLQRGLHLPFSHNVSLNFYTLAGGASLNLPSQALSSFIFSTTEESKGVDGMTFARVNASWWAKYAVMPKYQMTGQYANALVRICDIW